MKHPHTPGPWELRQSTRHGYWFIDHESQEGSVTLTKLDCGEADARLLASAPDLLAALQGLMQYVGGWDESGDHPCAIARAAIEKATGEQP
jgi:hypothetical protein